MDLVRAVALLSAVVILGFLWIRHLGQVHWHCIKVTGIALREYAQNHGGALPFHTNGFGDAMLLLVRERSLPGGPAFAGPVTMGLY